MLKPWLVRLWLYFNSFDKNKDLFNLQPYFSSLKVFEGVGFFELHVNVCYIFTLQLYIFYGVIEFCCFM